MKKTIIWIVIIIVLAVAAYYIFGNSGSSPASDTGNTSGIDMNTPTTTDQTATTTDMTKQSGVEDIGTSVDGRKIEAYHFLPPPATAGSLKEIVFVAGLHGGYEWNTSLVAYKLIDYLTSTPSAVPAGVEVTVIPAANPDGLYKVTGKDGVFTSADVASSQATQVAGRFNANKVDLNRNFDCDWQSTGTWQSTPVSGGSAAFSEPESAALRDYIAKNQPAAAIVYYSAAGGVFSSSCHNGVSTETKTLTSLYANASGYPPYADFDFYQITGDMVNWLAKENIPAISVLLTNHSDVEWDKNKAGITAVLNHYAN